MRRRSCRLAQLGSAHLDGALADGERDRLLTHLLGCSSCRRQLDELRTLRALLAELADAPLQPTTPAELSVRLVSIAGVESATPLWCRPFRRTRAGVLPSRRLRVRATAAALALGGLVICYGVVGYAAAPAADLATVADPAGRARSQFAAMLSELPLTSRPVDPRLISPGADPWTTTTRSATSRNGSTGQPVTRAVAVAALRRASYPARRSLVAPVPVGAAQDRLLSLLQHNYEISGWRGSRVLGRSVTVVQASARGGSPGEVVARWWVDDVSGLLLRQERYDASGVTGGAGVAVVVSARRTVTEHVAPRLGSSSTATIASAGSSDLRLSGWPCPPELAGLSLVLRADDPGAPGVGLLYSDGLRSVSVLQQRGELASPPAGSRWDPALQAHLQSGVSPTATWRSGDDVVTVVTDAPALLSQVVPALPHVESPSRTTMDRVQAGWSRIRAHVTG